jgi:4-nitrophenyl phosphatase
MSPPKLYVFDLDGTLYRGSEIIPHTVEVVRELRLRGHQIRFLTNNSGVHPTRICSKLQGMGYESELHEIFTSAMGAGMWMQENNLNRAFIVGENGLSETLAEYGVSSSSSEPQAVIAGICRSLTYQWINQAMQFIWGGAQFIATNRDSAYPIENGKFEPGAGATVAAIEACTRFEPKVIGKPETYLLEKIRQESNVEFENMVVVGDRLDTDIEAGKRAKCRTFLVLTGTTTEPANDQWSRNDLRALLE